MTTDVLTGVELMRVLLTKKETANRLGLHPESLMRLTRAGQFPKPIKLGSGSDNCAVRFIEAEVNAWIEAKMAGRAA